MIFTPSGPKDDLFDAISRFLQDCLIRNNNETENLEVRGPHIYEEIVIYLIQIEAKFGILLDKGTNSRIELPVLSECSKTGFFF